METTMQGLTDETKARRAARQITWGDKAVDPAAIPGLAAPLLLSGWQCPACKRVYAPSVGYCNCQAKSVTSGSQGGLPE